MRIFCPFLSPRRGRADILFRRAVLRSIPPFFSPDKAKISRICELKKFRCANVKFFYDRRALQGVVLNLSKQNSIKNCRMVYIGWGLAPAENPHEYYVL